MFDWLTRNFAVVSVGVLVIASSITMLFLFAYLSVFDWTLVWLIEYPDMAKLFLLSAALLSTYLALFLNISQQIYNRSTASHANAYFWGSIMLLILLAAPAIDLFNDIKTQNGLTFFHVQLTMCTIMLFSLPVISFLKFEQLAKGSPYHVLGLAVVCLTIVAMGALFTERM